MSPQGWGGAARAWGGVGATASPGRYQGLEQRLEAELQAAATSKEEALRELKTRALQLEEELVQVSLRPRVLRASSHLALHAACRQTDRQTDIRGCQHSCPSSPALGLPLDFCPVTCLVPHLGAYWGVPCAGAQVDSAQALSSPGGPCFPHSSNGQAPAALL